MHERHVEGDENDVAGSGVIEDAAIGKEIGLGRPPAKEIISGSPKTFRMSRIKDDGVLRILSE